MDAEMSRWYSSYGVITAQRLFENLNVHLSYDELLLLNNHPKSCYYQLLQVPLKNIFNGIIIDQTTDYREYAQKMLIDYLISGAANPTDEQSNLAGAKLELEDMRRELIEEGDQFDMLQFEHHKLILDSQKLLLKLAKKLPKPVNVQETRVDEAFMTAISPLFGQTELITQKVKSFRARFLQTILRGRALLNTLPDYFNRFEGDIAHLEALDFDAKLGDEQS